MIKRSYAPFSATCSEAIQFLEKMRVDNTMLQTLKAFSTQIVLRVLRYLDRITLSRYQLFTCFFKNSNEYWFHFCSQFGSRASCNVRKN